MKKNDIILSVAILSYNQEKYIGQAIESVLNQKTNYKYEILLADDCSSDKTLEIMKKYEKKHPDIIKVLKREKNLGANKNLLDAAKHSKGKYFALLEGDDYWIDENKIQIQVDFLEKNEDYIGISHVQQGVSVEGKKLGIYPKWIKKDSEITMKNYMKGQNYSATACIYRNYFKEDKYKDELNFYFSLHSLVSDVQTGFFELKHGKIYNLYRPMMAYRIIRKKGEENYNSKNKAVEIVLNSSRILSEVDKYNDYKYNFWKRFSLYYSDIFLLSILSGNLKNIKKFFEICPKKYYLKVQLVLPIKCIKKLFSYFLGVFK